MTTLGHSSAGPEQSYEWRVAIRFAPDPAIPSFTHWRASRTATRADLDQALYEYGAPTDVWVERREVGEPERVGGDE